MYRFHLYRIKTERPEQTSIFDDIQKTPKDFILSAAQEKLSEEIRKNHIWKIGNFEKIDNDGFLFALGRVSKLTREKYDEGEGRFKDEMREEAPYTYVVVDLAYQVCAIAQKSTVANQPSDIAKNLSRLLNKSKTAERYNIKFRIAEISDPSEFIEFLRTAIVIRKFQISFTKPNPFDVEQDYHLPMENLLQAANAIEGKTTIKGEDIDPNTVEKLAISAASTGDDACAELKLPEGKKFVTKRLKGNTAMILFNELGNEDEKLKFINYLRETYNKVRGSVE